MEPEGSSPCVRRRAVGFCSEHVESILHLCIHFFLNIIYYIILSSKSRDSTVGIATGYGLDGRGSIPGKGQEIILRSFQTGFGTHPASYPMGTEGLFPRGKAVGEWS
jgi:hypothetical protein